MLYNKDGTENLSKMNFCSKISAISALIVFASLLLFSGAAIANESNQVQNQSESAPLKSIVNESLEASIEPGEIIERGKHGLKVTVKNNSDRAVIFNGEKASVFVHGNEYKCENMDEFEDLSGSQPNFLSELNRDTRSTVAAAVSVGGLQTVSDLLKSRKPTLDRFGKDEKRREEILEQFGQRILWPGDASTGIIMFPASEPLTNAQVAIPVSSFFNAKDQAVLSSKSKQDSSKSSK